MIPSERSQYVSPTCGARNQIPAIRRIKQEEARLSDPYKLSDSRKRASSGYGRRIHPKTNQPEFHPGSDFGAPEGTTIPSAASGVVVYSGKNEGGYGNTVIVKNDTGDYSLYAHMRGDNQVKPGQGLWKGDTVGVVGNTGESTGPHVHYSVITKEAGRIYDAAHPRDGGPIGLHPDQTNTYDPATYGNYVLPPPPYLDQSRRASKILSGLDETSSRNGGSPPDRPGQPFFSPFNQPTPAPAKAAPPSTPASSNVFADRYPAWGTVPLPNAPAASDAPANFADRFGNRASVISGVPDNIAPPNATPPKPGQRSEIPDDVTPTPADDQTPPVRRLANLSSPVATSAPPLAPSASTPLLGIVSGQPMRDYPCRRRSSSQRTHRRVTMTSCSSAG